MNSGKSKQGFSINLRIVLSQIGEICFPPEVSARRCTLTGLVWKLLQLQMSLHNLPDNMERGDSRLRCKVHLFITLFNWLISISTLFKEKGMEILPRTLLNFSGSKKKPLVYLQRAVVVHLHLKHDKWEFYIHHSSHKKYLTMLFDFKTLSVHIGDIFKIHGTFFSLLIWTVILETISPDLLSWGW